MHYRFICKEHFSSIVPNNQELSLPLELSSFTITNAQWGIQEYHDVDLRRPSYVHHHSSSLMLVSDFREENKKK